MKVGIVNAPFVLYHLCYDLVIPKGIERTCREEQRYKRKVGKMKEELNDLLSAIYYDLKEKLERFDKFTENVYEQGIMDGINICIGVIDKYK